MITSTITILLAYKHQVELDVLRGYLKRDPNFEVIGEVAFAADLVAVALDLEPRIVILADSTEDDVLRLRRAIPSVGIVVLCEPDPDRILAALRCGVSACVLNTDVAQELTTAIVQVASGQCYLSRRSASLLQSELTGITTSSQRTDRERKIMELIAEGKTLTEIAFHLGLSLKTVESYSDRWRRFLPGFFLTHKG